MKGPGRWTRMAYLWPLLQADPPRRRPPAPPDQAPEEFETPPEGGAPPVDEFEEASGEPAGADEPEEFEEAPQPAEGAPPVQGPEEFEPAYPAGAPPEGTPVQPPGEFESPPGGGASPVVEFGEAPGGPAGAGEPEEFEEAPKLRIAKPAPPPVEFETPPEGGASPVDEFGEAPGEPTPEASGGPAGAGEPEAFDVAPEEEIQETAPVSLRSAPPAKEGAGRAGRGLTNGLTNGRGGVNGQGLTNGRGRINGRGLTNGRGRTNGRGLTNGGLTNGRGGINGRGLTNGRGMVNGRRKGLVNGAGLVNGRRRRGLVNGDGLVNGNGFINGRGLVNGKGLINGQGLTNGRQLTAAEVVPSRPKVRRNMGLAAAAIAVALLIIIPVLYYTQIQKGVAIDGLFDDWKGVSNRYSDGDAQPSPGTDANVDISEFGATATATDLAVYVKVSGSMLRGANGGVDTLTVFISSGRTGSGYRLNTPGGVIDADYKLEIYGYDGAVRSASYSKFEGGDANDYGGWTSLGGARAASSGSELEASVWFQGTDLSQGSDASILFYMRNAFGEEDYSDFTVGLTTGVLAVKQREPVGTGGGATMSLELGAYGRQVNLTSLRVTKAGGAGGGSLALRGAGIDRDTSFGAEAIFAGLVVGIAQDSRVLLSLEANGFSGGAFGMFVSGPNSVTATTGGRAVHVSVSGYSTALFYTGGASPGVISIDGAFEDWEATRGQPGWDARGDGSDDFEEPAKAGSPGLVARGGSVRYGDDNVNLQEVAEYNPGGGTVYYYARVAGQALGGQVVPATKRSLPGPGGGGGGNPPAHVGSDVFYVLVDDDGNKATGFPVRNADGDTIIGARYCVLVVGKNGQVLDSKTYTFSAGWTEGGPSRIAAAGGKKVEVAVSGLSLLPGHKALIIAEDWTGNADRSDIAVGASGRSAVGPSLEVIEADASRHAVQVGSSRNPMFRLEMDALNGPISVNSVELRRDGTAPDADITAIHLTVDANGDGVFSRTDPEIAAATTFVDGKAVFTGQQGSEAERQQGTTTAPIITVQPGQRVVLFVSIDVSASATLYSTFGVKVSRLDTSADSVNFVNSRPTGDIVITKTGGRGISDIVINEVGRVSTGLGWVEIYNKKGSSVSGWWISVIWTTSAQPPEACKWNSSTFDLADGSYKAIDVGQDPGNGEYAPWSTTVTIKLVDSGDSTYATYTRFPSDVSSGGSDARYRDTDNTPMNSWYTDSSNTKGSQNLLIPEFSDIAYPLAGIIAIFMIVRTSNSRKKRKNGEEH